LRIGTEVAVRACLGRVEPERCHLGEHSVRGQLGSPSGHLANPPRDRPPGIARNRGMGVSCSVVPEGLLGTLVR
jgi:hypothetical protein